jgi:transitional endoplasmic reticulum ATPase
MVEVEPMFPEQMITSNFFYALARREAIPGVVLQQIKFGAFRVQFEAHSFIIYIVTVPKNTWVAFRNSLLP